MRRAALFTPLLAALLVLCLAPGLRAQELAPRNLVKAGSCRPTRPRAA